MFLIFIRFRALFVHMLPCLALVILNILLFRAMREADRKRERLLTTRAVSSASNAIENTSTTTNIMKLKNGKESMESKKIRDTNNTTMMLVVVISVSLDQIFENVTKFVHLILLCCYSDITKMHCVYKFYFIGISGS